jgi:hypothetical protein
VRLPSRHSASTHVIVAPPSRRACRIVGLAHPLLPVVQIHALFICFLSQQVQRTTPPRSFPSCCLRKFARLYRTSDRREVAITPLRVNSRCRHAAVSQSMSRYRSCSSSLLPYFLDPYPLHLFFISAGSENHTVRTLSFLLSPQVREIVPVRRLLHPFQQATLSERSGKPFQFCTLL